MIGIKLLSLTMLNGFRAYNHLTHDLGHDSARLVGCFLNLLVAHLNRVVETAQVSDNRNTKGADAAVVSNDNLWYGTHTYGVATKDAIHLIFCRSLKGGTLNAHIDAILQANLLFACYLTSQLDERLVIGLVHIWEARTRREVLTTQWVLREKVDMVCDNHQVANFETRVHAAGGITYKEGFYAKFVHDAYREGYLFH